MKNRLWFLYEDRLTKQRGNNSEAFSLSISEFGKLHCIVLKLAFSLLCHDFLHIVYLLPAVCTRIVEYKRKLVKPSAQHHWKCKCLLESFKSAPFSGHQFICCLLYYTFKDHSKYMKLLSIFSIWELTCASQTDALLVRFI